MIVNKENIKKFLDPVLWSRSRSGAFTHSQNLVYLSHTLSLSLLQAVDLSDEESATQVLCLHLALFSTSTKSSRKFSMLYLTTSIHLFLCLSQLRYLQTFASRICLTQWSSSRRCTCQNHFSLPSHTLSAIHATLWMQWMISFLFLSLKIKIHRNIVILVLFKHTSSHLFSVHASEP